MTDEVRGRLARLLKECGRRGFKVAVCREQDGRFHLELVPIGERSRQPATPSPTPANRREQYYERRMQDLGRAAEKRW